MYIVLFYICNFHTFSLSDKYLDTRLEFVHKPLGLFLRETLVDLVRF